MKKLVKGASLLDDNELGTSLFLDGFLHRIVPLAKDNRCRMRLKSC